MAWMCRCSHRRTPRWRSGVAYPGCVSAFQRIQPAEGRQEAGPYLVDIYWLEQNDSDVPFGDQWLSGSERATLASLRIPKRRADWRLGRWTAKCAVARYWNLPRSLEALAAVELLPAPSGAPKAFLHGRPAPVTLSLSHSRGTGLFVIAPARAAGGSDLPKSRAA